MSKKLVPVEILSATVWYRDSKQIDFLAQDMLLYRIDFGEQPEFKKFDLEEGTCVWIYYITANRKVSGIIPYDPAITKDQLPQAAPVEVDMKVKEARY